MIDKRQYPYYHKVVEVKIQFGYHDLFNSGKTYDFPANTLFFVVDVKKIYEWGFFEYILKPLTNTNITSELVRCPGVFMAQQGKYYDKDWNIIDNKEKE